MQMLKIRSGILSFNRADIQSTFVTSRRQEVMDWEMDGSILLEYQTKFLTDMSRYEEYRENCQFRGGAQNYKRYDRK